MIPSPRALVLLIGLLAVCALSARGASDGNKTVHEAGVASVDITPDYNVRLNGFGHRRSESEGITAKIYAKALAFRDQNNNPAVLVAVDSLGVPDYRTTEVAKRLKQKANLDPARFAITSTHTHTAPMLKDCCPNIQGAPIPSNEQEKIDRYTRELTDKIEEVSLAALKDLKPARIEYGIGTHALAKNRRTPGGPVDHDLPVMAIKDPASGNLRAVYISYACHCVTLSHMKISGDWAGYAAEAIEKNHPGAIALTSIGCGADANPTSNVTGDKVGVAIEQGQQLAAATDRVLSQQGGLTPLDRPIATNLNRISLAFGEIPMREYWEKVGKQQDYQGYHARVQLAKLDRGEKLQTELSYPIQTWTFGDQLAMVFLPGEVVVDYSIRLKKELDRNRLWINAYSNDVPCYIPSERILKEGGYEVDSSMWFYDRPTRLASGIEEKIIDEVHRQIPESFNAPKGTEGVPPRSPESSLRTIRTKPGLEVELVESEPLIQSPVAIDWSADGRLWVCEMYDYPTGADNNWRPGGRVKVLEDSDRNGKYDKATLFLENIPFPTGITAWGKGILVCAAPDILYATDENNDGKADKVEKLFTGFATDNYQARVNSLSLGLDNWIYAGNGLLGGTITNSSGLKAEIRNRDFRFRLPNGPLETVTGLTQFGRVRDDWGNWYGCDNSSPILSYPHEERYLRRNPHVEAPAPIVRPKTDHDIGRVYPISRTLDRYNEPNSANRVTSACGLAVYRDDLLPGLQNHAFFSEPVHNLVSRMTIEPGDAFRVSRASDERTSEFLASTDNWFRPTQIRTGPDGALYIVDIYRFLIEHPRWIPAERLAQIDVRAGADMGRIYRVRAEGKDLRSVRDLMKLNGSELAAALDSPNGTERDRVHVELLHRHDESAVAKLKELAAKASLPQVRVQALSVLEGIGSLEPSLLSRALKDGDAQVRAHALRLCESQHDLLQNVLATATDPSPLVRRQLAFTLGEFTDPRAGETLASLATADLDDPAMRIAVLSSSSYHCGPVLAAIAKFANPATRSKWLPPLVATAAASKDERLVAAAMEAVLPAEGRDPSLQELTPLVSLLDALGPEHAVLREPRFQSRLQKALTFARRAAEDSATPEQLRAAALRVLGRGDLSGVALDLFVGLVTSVAPAASLRETALATLRRQQSDDVAARLLSNWKQSSPSARADIITLLLGRESWTSALLDAVKKRQIQPNEISLTDRQLLANNGNEAIRKMAAELFAADRPSATRAEVLTRYANIASLPATPATGAELFSKNCAACHALGGIGNDVGASLAALRHKDPDYFVKNILDPSSVVEPRFVNYNVTLKDRRVISGIIKSETTTSLTLVSGGGVSTSTETIPRSNIKEIRATSISMMPEGFESALPPHQMADLIAFLKQSAPRKEFAENRPALVKQAKGGSVLLPATKAEIFGDQIMLESEYKNIGYWHGQGDYVLWRIDIDKPGDFDVHLDFACEERSSGNAFILEAGGRSITGVVPPTGPDWTRYRQQKFGTINLPAGEHRVIVRPSNPVRGALIDLRTIALAASGAQPKWPPPSTATVAAAGGADELARDPAAVARVILDASKSNGAREAAVNANPQFAAELITELTRDLTPGSPAEYQRIPWIWRVAIAAGKRNDAATLKKMLDTSLPQLDQPLYDWQAVVIGGGIINGISLQNTYPAPRIAEILAGDETLLKRYHRALDLSSTMADNEKVPTGTRYDALRMLGVEPWDKRGAQLVRYLSKDAHPELQQGAVSGLADVQSPQAAKALIDAIPHLSEGNRNFALDALLRDADRASALLDAIERKQLDPKLLGEARTKQLVNHRDEAIRKRATAILAS